MEEESRRPLVPNQEVMSPKHTTETKEEPLEVREVPLIQADEKVTGLEVIGQELVPIGAPLNGGKGNTSLELVPATPLKATEKASSQFRSAVSLEGKFVVASSKLGSL